MGYFKPEEFMSSKTEQDLKSRLHQIGDKIFYEYEIDTYLLIIEGGEFAKQSNLFSKGDLKKRYGTKRTLGVVDYYIICNEIYRNRELYTGYNGVRDFYTNFSEIEDKLTAFNSIKDSKLINGRESKHVLYRGDNFYAQIQRVSSGGQIKCILFDYNNDFTTGLENHVGFTNIKNLKAVI